ncbi:hypothetical protein [Staphylococcus equorum]|uniref:hypothetical protein n=1 Tax=Staphylococcus equorum TaxID=246432 RepID=UPI000852AB7C|nr:hypothetical protein [Staphylococcus equorum]OEL08268.1 hypothetical protein AST04_08770 [Staphylococcus equorum]
MKNDKSKLNYKEGWFVDYKWSLKIVLTGIIMTFVFRFIAKDFSFIPTLLSTMVPLLVLILKIEYDEVKQKEEQQLVGRNFLLAYSIGINELLKQFRKYKTINKPSKIFSLNTYILHTENVEKKYENLKIYLNMVENKNEIYKQIEITEQMIKAIEGRQEVHGEFKLILTKMLKHKELVFTHEQYHELTLIQYAYMWQFTDKLPEYKKTIDECKTNFDLYLDRDEAYGTTILVPKWNDFVNAIKSVETQMNYEIKVYEQMNRLIDTLKFYDPIDEQESSVIPSKK